MNLYYKVLSSSENYTIEEGNINFWLYFDDLKEYSFDTSIIEERYKIFNFLNASKVNVMYIFSKEMKAKKSFGWQKGNIFFEKEEEIVFWIERLKEYVASIQLTTNNDLELLAKLKVMCAIYIEACKTGYESYTLDAEYGLLFESNANPLNIEYQLVNFEYEVNTGPFIKLYANCQFKVKNDFSPDEVIPFKVLIASPEQLLHEYKVDKKNYLTMILSTHIDESSFEAYLKHTFSSFKAGSLEELYLKIATFAHEFTIPNNDKKITENNQVITLTLLPFIESNY